MLSSLRWLLLCGSIAFALGNAQKLPKDKKPSLKVHINTTSDSIFLKFLRPSPNTKLEGFLLGYGSNVSPNQYFPLSMEGKYTEAVVDAEPKYLIVVRPAPSPSQKKSCSGKSRPRKPLQLVVGTLTPSSVFLSWGFLINPHHDWTMPSQCSNDRLYTIRYREKDKEKKWVFQLCPATETIVENLKPNTVYEFGVKDNMEGGLWSKIFNHKTVVGSKNKVNGKIQSTYDQVHTVPGYVPRKLIPITIIKEVIQNITHKASTKSPEKIPFGGTILVHLIIPGMNETTVRLPTSIMLEISDALKAQLAKNESLALPAESKTPEIEKIPAQPITVTPGTVPRTTKPTVSAAFDILETTRAPKRVPEFPEEETSFPFEKPEGTLASSERPWMASTAKAPEDSKVVRPPTATSDPVLESVPPKTSRTLEQPRATILAPSEIPFASQKVETFPSRERQPTTSAPQQTTSTPSTSKRRPRPKPPTTKPAPEPQTLPPSQSTKAPPKTKRPGRRPRPKTTRSPEVPKSKPALEPTTVQLELVVPTIAPKPSKRPQITHRPDVPQIQPVSEPPKQLPAKSISTAKPDMLPTKSVFESITFETEAPAVTIVSTTDIEAVIVRTESPVTTLAPTTTQRARTRRPRPKHKTTPSPKIPQPKPDLGPVTPGPSLAPTTKRTRRPRPKPKTTPHPQVPQTILVPATIFEPVIPKTDAPRMSLVLTTVFEPIKESSGTASVPVTDLEAITSPEPVTSLLPVTALEPVTSLQSVTAMEPVTKLQPVTFRFETPGTKIASKTPQRTHRPRPRPKTTPSPQAPQTKPVPAVLPEPVTLTPETPTTALAPKIPQRTRHPRPRPKPTPSSAAPALKPVPTAELERVTLRAETGVTTRVPKTPKRTRRPRPKPQTTPTPEAPQTKLVPATDLEPAALRTEAPETVVLTTVLEPLTLRTKAAETTLAPKTQRMRRPRPRPKTTASTEVSQSKSVPVPDFGPEIHSTQSPGTTLVSDVLEPVSTESSKETIEPTETDYTHTTTKSSLRPGEPVTEEPSPLPFHTIILPSPDGPQTKPAPRQTLRTPPKSKTLPGPRVPQTQPVPNGSQKTTSKPKMPSSPEVSYTTPVAKDVFLPQKPDPEVSQSEPVLQPVTFRIEAPRTTVAPLETRGIPFIHIISPTPFQEELQSTPEETDQFTQEFFTTKIPQTTELAKTTQAPHRLYTVPGRPRTPDKPHIRPVLNRTTTKPIRVKPNGLPGGNGVKTGIKQTPKPSSTVKNVPIDSSHVTKKPATIPGTRRPPFPPRPMPPRRKPLPPNNVTGKPGSSGIISSSRVTSPPLRATLKPTGTPSERPEIDKKQPTVPASGEDLGNTTNFSSSPTRETDHLGKPRFKGPHVKYIPKPDNRPCSITDSVKWFPTEEAVEGNATSPPQNPPTNLTVVTVEGCPSFVILDWEKPLNDTVTEYEVISRENGSFSGKNKSIQLTNQTFSTVENLKPDTSYEFQVKPKNPLGEGPASNTVAFSTESADPRVSEPVSAGRDAIWTERPFNSDSYSECKGKQYVKRTWYKKFVGVQLCNSLRYKIYLSDSLTGKFYNIGDQRGHGEDHCQFVDSFLDGRTGQQLTSDQLPTKEGYFRAVRQEPVQFGEIGGHTQINYVQWYECGTTIPGKW
ncbi:target of Nesh-SH3 [Thomomys bottae]